MRGAGLLASAYRALAGASAHACPYGDHRRTALTARMTESRPDGEPRCAVRQQRGLRTP